MAHAFGKVMIPAIILFAAAISDPLHWAAALGIGKSPDWEYPAVWRQVLFFILLLAYLLGWFHKTRVAYYGQTENEMTAQKLKELRATGKAQKAYAQEVAEVPKSEADLAMGDHYKNNGTMYGDMGPTNSY